MTSCTYNGDTTTYTYGYDGLRRSSTKDSVTTNYVYDGTNLVAEMRPNASGTLVVVTDYLLGAQGIEAKIDETNQTEAYYQLDPTTGARLFDANNNLIVAYRGATSWYIYDGHGNVVGTVNGVTGAFAANPTLDVYGIPRASGALATKQGYCGSIGHMTDDTGLVYMRARYYDPSVGRFVSEDPSYHGCNWYVYANDNPVSMADQDGRSSFFFTVTSLMQNWGAAALGVDLAFMSMLTGPSLIGKAVSFALAGAAVFSFAVAFGASPTAATWATVCAEFSVAAEIWWSQSLAAVNSASVAGGVARGVVEAALCYALVLTAACVMDDLDQ